MMAGPDILTLIHSAMQKPPEKPQEPQKPERPRRYLPPWRRLLLEYIAIALSYIAILLLTGNALIGIIVMLAVLFLLRWTRPPYYRKPDDKNDQKK